MRHAVPCLAIGASWKEQNTQLQKVKETKRKSPVLSTAFPAFANIYGLEARETGRVPIYSRKELFERYL